MLWICGSADVASHVRRIQSNDGRHITERHVLLGQHTEAVQMLLETDAKDASFYVDSLRACVIAAVRTPETAQNTIKLVAMNLIAASNLAGDLFICTWHSVSSSRVCACMCTHVFTCTCVRV
jgi:hypothetical protein